MRSVFALAFSALALNSVAAAPLAAKRDNDNIIWHTVYKHVIKTVDVYTTIWVQPGQHAPEPTTPSVAAPQTTAAPVEQYTPAPAPPAPAPTTPTSQAPPPPPPSSSSPAAPAYTPKVETPQQQPTPTPTPSPQQQYQPPAPSPTPSPSPSPAPAPSPSPSPSPSAQPQSQGQSYTGGSGALFKGFTNPLPGAQVKYDCAGGCSGDMTFFNPSQGVGACGYKDGVSTIWTDQDDVVAVAVNMMGTLSSGDTPNPFCGKKINIKNPHNGKTATGLVTDKCAGCEGNQDIDLSPHLYDQLAAEGDGRIHDVEWSWAD